MSRGRQYIQFEGYFAENVLGIFRVIRGFADPRDLAAVSVPYEMTDHRPNVYVEAGYALKHHEQNRLIYLFEPQDSGDRVPFDLNTFKYVQISQAAEIQGRLTPEIKAILEDAGAVLERETS